MRIGLALPHYDFSFPDGGALSWERLSAAAQRAEGFGFDSLWISDHFFLSLERYGGGPEPQGSVEPLTALAGLAVATSRARLGALVLCAGFRHPAIVAKAAASLDLLSRGRLDLGLGAGWYEHEHRAFGYPFPRIGERFAILEETVAAVGALLGLDEPVNFEGKRFRLTEAYNRPRPVQKPRPPLWVGGKGGPRLLSLVARHADGWNAAWQWTVDDYRDRVRALEAACAREGRDPATVRRSVGLYTLVGEDRRDLEERYRALQRWTPGALLDGVPLEAYGTARLVGVPEELLERLRSFANLGVEEVIVSAASVPFAVLDETMLEILAREVLPAARDL